MAKHLIEIDLDSPDDQKSLLRYAKSKDMASVLFQMANNAKRKFKHSENDDFLQGVDAVLDHFNQLIEDNGIVIEDLID